MFSLNRAPSTLPGYKGVYLLSSRKSLYKYERGRSSLAYIGSGTVADRLPAHLQRKDDLREVLAEEGTMWIWYASASRGSHPCVEQALFDAFEERHGDRPILNKVRPSCPVPWDDLTVRNENLAFPFDFSRTGYP